MWVLFPFMKFKQAIQAKDNEEATNFQHKSFEGKKKVELFFLCSRGNFLRGRQPYKKTKKKRKERGGNG